MVTFTEVFGASTIGDAPSSPIRQGVHPLSWRFELHERFNGAFGGTNGGVLSAISVHAARAASGRRPASIDSRYLRGFAPGPAEVTATVLSAGRTLTVLTVDVADAEQRVCCHSVVTLVDSDALAAELEVTPDISPPDGLVSWADGKPWPQPARQNIPLIPTFEPRAVGGQGHETTTATRVLWEQEDTAAEAACIAADISVGPPVARAVRGSASTPNPDLSLRFCAREAPGEYLSATCQLRTVDAGLASTSISVWNPNAALLAVGISTTTCLPYR